MTEPEDLNPVRDAERDGRLKQWARLVVSADAQLALSLLPFGGHVRLRPSVEVAENPANAPPPPAAPGGTFSWSAGWAAPGAGDEDIEGFTIEADHIIKFLRASGETRQASKDRTTSALTELMLRGLVKVFQDETEAPRYALTDDGLKVQEALK